MIPTKKDNHHTPVSVSEIIEDVLKCAKLGASMVHLHARDENEKPTYKKEIYAELIAGIREQNDEIILGVSTSGRDFKEFAQRSECIELTGNLKPDMASLTLSSLNFNKQESINSPEMIVKLATKIDEKNIKPELEVFDSGMINYSKYLISKGIIKPPFYYNILLGNIACAQATPLSIGLLSSELPQDSIWCLAGIGNFQLRSNVMGIMFGHGVRIGMEDNFWYDEERTNASFIGFAPADNPKFVMLITLREPQSSPWASETAAPLWFEIAKDMFPYLGIQPEN